MKVQNFAVKDIHHHGIYRKITPKTCKARIVYVAYSKVFVRISGLALASRQAKIVVFVFIDEVAFANATSLYASHQLVKFERVDVINLDVVVINFSPQKRVSHATTD